MTMANKPRKYCAAFPCRNLAETGSAYCNFHRPAPAIKQTDAFYVSKAWRRFRTYYMALHPLCEQCESIQLYIPSVICDHIIELKDGGAPLDEANVQALCASCHNKKTASEKNKRKNHQ